MNQIQSSEQARKRIEKLAVGSIGRLLVEYSWPALVAMSLNALYAVVDRFYIGKGCGEDAMAGLTLTFPVMMLFGAFGVFVGAGHAALLSIKLGESNRTACEKLLGELVALKLLLFAILPPLVFFNIDTVLGWCGGAKVSAGAFACAKNYLRLVIFFHVFSHLSFGLSAMMRSEGSAIRSMMCMAVGFGVNLVLDPIFIFGFGMGIEGAAWATNIAMAGSCAFAFSHYLRGRSAVRFRLRRIGIYREFVWRAGAIGFAPFLQHLLGAAINVSLAAAFSRWAADESAATTQIASLGVMQSMLILVLMPVLGAQQGLQPIIGYNWGAHNYRRVRETVMTGLWMTTAIVVVACIIQTVPPFPEWMARMFVASGIRSADLQLHALVHFAQYRRHHLFPVDRQAHDRHYPFDAPARGLHIAGNLVPAAFYAEQDAGHMAFDADFRCRLLSDDRRAVRFAYALSRSCAETETQYRNFVKFPGGDIAEA